MMGFAFVALAVLASVAVPVHGVHDKTWKLAGKASEDNLEDIHQIWAAGRRSSYWENANCIS